MHQYRETGTHENQPNALYMGQSDQQTLPIFIAVFRTVNQVCSGVGEMGAKCVGEGFLFFRTVSAHRLY